MKKCKHTALIPICTTILLCIFFLLTGCETHKQIERERSGQISQTRLLLDTFCKITIICADDSEYDTVQATMEEAFAMCEELEKLMSITAEGSDVWRINNAGGQPVTADRRTIEVIERGIEFGVISDGKFDITIGRLSRLWDFGGSEQHVPAEKERAAAQETVNYGQVNIIEKFENTEESHSGTMPQKKAVQLQNPEAWLDLGGIAKGYIADQIAELLKVRGIENALIDLGGDIVAVGNKPGGEPWRLGVKRPFAADDEFLCVLEVTGCAVISSGTYERGFEKDGIQYHHILDPHTGMPAQNDIIAATIIADNAVTGEGLSTIAILTGSGKIQELCMQTDGFIGAVLVTENFEIITLGEVKFSQ